MPLGVTVLSEALNNDPASNTVLKMRECLQGDSIDSVKKITRQAARHGESDK